MLTHWFDAHMWQLLNTSFMKFQCHFIIYVNLSSLIWLFPNNEVLWTQMFSLKYLLSHYKHWKETSSTGNIFYSIINTEKAIFVLIFPFVLARRILKICTLYIKQILEDSGKLRQMGRDGSTPVIMGLAFLGFRSPYR